MTLQFPYGLASFAHLRDRGMVYVDRTAFIRTIESLGEILVFLRPRRFGKSLWLDTLGCYYDIRRAETFDEMFAGLHIGSHPTPLKNRYFVLEWDFSTINALGNLDQIADSLEEHVRERAKTFARRYQDYFQTPVDLTGSPAAILENIVRAIEDSGHAIYLLIDEYDNFINEVMVRDETLYRALLESDGPLKLLFKNVKAATRRGIERVFITGVSPVVLNDLSSGFNNAKDVTHDPSLAGLCGFTAREVSAIFTQIADAGDLAEDARQETLNIIRTWYNGYRFVQESPEPLYNPTNTFYFFDYFARHGTSPTELHDQNLRMDRSKLEFVTRQTSSWDLVQALTETGRSELPIVPQRSFSLHDLTTGLREDERVAASFLYYLGLVTLTEDVPPYLTPPNLAIRKMFLERLVDLYIPRIQDTRAGQKAAQHFFEHGDLQPLIAYLEQTFLPILSNRDRGAEPKRAGLGGSGVNETVLKVLLLALLFDDYRYYAFSEPEVDRGYADLCLIVRPELRHPKRFDVLFEFKLVRSKALGLSPASLRNMSKEDLHQLPAVKDAFDQAREQIVRYAAALKDRFGDLLRLRSFTVVAVDLERILLEVHPSE